MSLMMPDGKSWTTSLPTTQGTKNSQQPGSYYQGFNPATQNPYGQPQQQTQQPTATPSKSGDFSAYAPGKAQPTQTPSLGTFYGQSAATQQPAQANPYANMQPGVYAPGGQFYGGNQSEGLAQAMRQRDAFVQQSMQAMLPYQVANFTKQDLGPPQFDLQGMRNAAAQMVQDGFYNPFTQYFQQQQQQTMAPEFLNPYAPPSLYGNPYFMPQTNPYFMQPPPMFGGPMMPPTAPPMQADPYQQWLSSLPGYQPRDQWMNKQPRAPQNPLGPQGFGDDIAYLPGDPRGPQGFGDDIAYLPGGATPLSRSDGWAGYYDPATNQTVTEREARPDPRATAARPGQAQPIQSQSQGTPYTPWRGQDLSLKATGGRVDDLNAAYDLFRASPGANTEWTRTQAGAKEIDEATLNRMMRDGSEFLPLPTQGGQKVRLGNDPSARTETVSVQVPVGRPNPVSGTQEYEKQLLRVTPQEKEAALLDSLARMASPGAGIGPYQDRSAEFANMQEVAKKDLEPLMRAGLARGDSYDTIAANARQYLLSDHVWQGRQARMSQPATQRADEFAGYGFPEEPSYARSYDWDGYRNWSRGEGATPQANDQFAKSQQYFTNARYSDWPAVRDRMASEEAAYRKRNATVTTPARTPGQAQPIQPQSQGGQYGTPTAAVAPVGGQRMHSSGAAGSGSTPTIPPHLRSYYDAIGSYNAAYGPQPAATQQPAVTPPGWMRLH